MPSLMAIIGGDSNPFKRELDQVRRIARETGGELARGLTEPLAKFASVAGIEEVVRKTVEWGERVSVLAQRLGISTDAVQAWNYALTLSGSSIESAAGFFEKLAMAREKALRGDEDSIRAFGKLKVAIDDLKNMRIEDIGLKIAQAFQGGDPQELISSLREVGGRGAGELVAAFREGLADSVNEAKEGGMIISNAVIEQFREAADQAKTIWQQFVAGIAPAIAWLMTKLEQMWRGLNAITRFTVGFVSGYKGKNPMQSAVESGKALVEEYAEKLSEQDRAAAARRTARQTTPGAPLEEETGKEAARESREAAELGERLAKLQDQNFLKSLDHEGKLAALRERIANAKEIAASGFLTEPERLKAAIQGEEFASQLAEEEKRTKGKLDRGKLTDLQTVGAFAPNVQLIDVNKKIHGELKSIHQTLRQRQGASTNGGGVSCVRF